MAVRLGRVGMEVFVHPRSPEKITEYWVGGFSGKWDCGVGQCLGNVNLMKQEPSMCPALYRVKVMLFFRVKASYSSKPQERSSMAASSFFVCPTFLPVKESASWSMGSSRIFVAWVQMISP